MILFAKFLPVSLKLLTVIGNFLQLPPKKATPVYVEDKNTWQNLKSPRELFEVAELNKAMRKRGDN